MIQELVLIDVAVLDDFLSDFFKGFLLLNKMQYCFSKVFLGIFALVLPGFEKIHDQVRIC